MSVDRFVLLSLLLFWNTFTMAQSRNLGDTVNFKSRQTILYTAAPVTYVSAMTGLYFLWYRNYPSSGFHFFNDNSEWLQMDKVGHSYTAYSVGSLGITTMRWAGIKNKKAIWYGGLSGFLFLTNIEVFDGFSDGWGFSWGDMTANTLGSTLLIGQELIWREQRIKMKYSFHPTRYSKYNPGLLGSNIYEGFIKDYNGQTYWLSVNIASFLSKEKRFPKWLNVAVGYGAEGMTGGKRNPEQVNNVVIPSFERYRQFYISPDIELSKINTKSKLLKAVFTMTSIKIPMPTFMVTDKGNAKFYFLYF